MICNYILLLFITVAISYSQVLRNLQSTYVTGVFITNDNSKLYGVTLLTNNRPNFNSCLYLCLKHLKCAAINFHQTEEVCELIEDVIDIKAQEGWLASNTIIDLSVVC